MTENTPKCQQLLQTLLDTKDKIPPGMKQNVLEYLAIQSNNHVRMLKYISQYPGLVQFVYKDRARGISISPGTDGLWKVPKTSQDLLEKNREIVRENRKNLGILMEQLIWESQSWQRLFYDSGGYKLLFRQFEDVYIWSVWMEAVPERHAEEMLMLIHEYFVNKLGQ